MKPKPRIVYANVTRADIDLLLRDFNCPLERALRREGHENACVGTVMMYTTGHIFKQLPQTRKFRAAFDTAPAKAKPGRYGFREVTGE